MPCRASFKLALALAFALQAIIFVMPYRASLKLALAFGCHLCDVASHFQTHVNFDVAVHVDGNVVKMLVGNKFDLAHIREVHLEDGKKLAESNGLFFIETLSLDNTNVLSAFQRARKC